MTSSSWPRPGHNGGFVTEYEYELLAYKNTPDGLVGFPTDAPPVYADTSTTRTVKIRARIYANLRGGVYYSGTTDISLPQLAPNTSGFPRVDLVVLRLNRSDYSIKETIIPGVPAANPAAPNPVRQSGSTGFYDLPLAEVFVPHNAGALTSDRVTTRCWYLGSDGQIRATWNNRPPTEAGRTFWEYPIDKLWVSNGDAWMLVVEDSGVKQMPLSPAFVSNHNAVYRRNGWAFGELTVNRPGGQLNANTVYTVATVPAGFRPPFLFQFAVVVPTATQSTAVGSMAPDGTVSVNPGGKAIPAGYSLVCALGAWPVRY